MHLQEGILSLGEQSTKEPETLKGSFIKFSFTLPGNLQATWWVARHTNGEDFSAEDRRILKTLAFQAEVALNNIVLVEVLSSQLDNIRTSRESLAAMQRQLLRSREDERSRLARDLHDGPLQTLADLNIQLGILLSNQGPTQDGKDQTIHTMNSLPLVKSLDDMRGEVRGMLEELRQVCAELRPPMLDMLGLGAAIRALADEWTGQYGIPIRMNLPGDAGLRALPDEVAVNLYRVVQEALANVARHAAARTVTISFTFDSGDLSLEIRDDGCGFDLESTLSDSTQHGHFGLAGIRERVDLIGGECTIHSLPGQGTTISIDWRNSL